jgi:signal transduction histidine kinase
MYYIEKLTRFSKREITFMHIGPAILVFAAFLGITIWSWRDQLRTMEANRSNILAKSVAETEVAVNMHVSAYIDLLNAGVGLFEASDYVSREEWRRFTNIFNLPNRYPGINSMGFVRVVPQKNLTSHIAAVRADKRPGYTIYPAGNRPVYANVVYAETEDKSNAKIVGYDMYSDDMLNSAMYKARDSGETTLTGMLAPNKNSPFSDKAALIIYSPIYAKGSRTENNDQRRNNIWGYVYMRVNTYELGNRFFKSSNPNFAFRIHDDSDNTNPIVYQSPNFDHIDSNNEAGGSLGQEFVVNDRQWTITGIVSPDVISLRDRDRPARTLWGGILFSVFLAGFIYMLLLNRAKALSDKETQEIQSAKDELLALASHQLRTPATGVKQYIGILREGYGGTMTARQKEFLDKAYASNERQLNIINDMLFVARADTGNIKFKLKRVDLLSLLKSILGEQSRLIEENNHHLVRRLPAKPLYVEADEEYLRMAIENLFSNAIKYTRQGGTITVKLARTKSRAVLTVEDTGVGVKKKYYHLLFRKFSRVPNDLTNKVSGSGIGLYLVKKIMDAHHGEIEFKSLSKKGSKCILTLPRVKVS